MNNRNYIIFLCLLLNIGLSHLYAQRQYIYAPIDARQGLSDDRIRYILQLQDGRMVINTEGVTNFYDGTSFKHIHLGANAVLPLTDFDGYLHSYADKDYVWSKYGQKLFLIDIQQECFVAKPERVFAAMGVHEPVADFIVDASKNYWIRTSSGKLLFKDVRAKQARVFLQKVNGADAVGDKLFDIALIRGRVYLFYRSGLMVCHELGTGRKLFEINTLSAAGLQRYTGTLRIVHSDSCIYQVRNTPEGPGVIISYDILRHKLATLIQTDYWLNIPTLDKQGNLWVGCRDGLWKIDRNQQQKQFIPSFELSDRTEVKGEITAQYHDSQGGIWIGTFNRGLLYYHPDRFKFRNIAMPDLDVTCILESSLGNIWVGTSKGLYRYNAESHSLTPFSGAPANAYCLSLSKDKESRVWLCTANNGLYCLAKADVRHYTIETNVIQQLYETSAGQLFAVTYQGLCSFDAALGRLQPIVFPKKMSNLNNASQLIGFEKNQLLGKGNSGLYIYDFEKKQFSQTLNVFTQNGPNYYNCIYRDKQGFVWIGTTDGIYVWHPGKKVLKRLYTDNGLVNASVKGIAEDRQGRIWVTTSEGVSCITRMGKEDDPVFSFSNFNHYDGIPNGEFIPRSICTTHDGLLLMGGEKGFSVLDLNKPWSSFNRLPKPLFTNLLLFGEKVMPDESNHGNPILNKSITATERVELKYNENFVTLEFSALNYVNPTQTCFRYRLEGVDDEWREVAARNGTGAASYTDLSPGTYRFMVKAANNSKAWGNEYATLVLVVKPPFWKTPLAYAAYLAIILLLLYYSFTIYEHRAHQRFIRKNEEKLNEIKFNFFTNISHEFRTPLTLIITPLESLLREVKETALEPKLRSIYRHARDLQGLVNQLLDFRRLEVSGERLNLTFGNIVEFVQQFDESFARLADERKIDFSVQSTLEERYLYFDREKLYRILNNLLANAFKYTSQGGRIALSITGVGDQLQIEVTDSGKGIHGKELPFIFNRFYQADGAKEGSGIGLHLVKEYVGLHSGKITVESEPNRRTCFTVTFPMNLTPRNESLEAEELVGEEMNQPQITFHSDTRFKLLVVEDNDDLRSFLVGELSKNYELIEAADGESGMELARTALPDLIISDVMMPKMNGLELCQCIKSDLQTSHIPVILLTARTSDEHKLQGYQSGADEYLSKPFNMDILLLRISKLIEQQNSRQQQFTQKIEVNPKEITITSLDEHLIGKALDLIEKNMDNPDYSVQQLSEDIGMDRTVLYKKLQSITGLAPSEFIRSIRLKRAAQLLSLGQLQVNEVADRVGFKSVRYFSKIFKETFGVIPSQYRQDEPGQSV
jgi:Signal transduction histidine kinase